MSADAQPSCEDVHHTHVCTECDFVSRVPQLQRGERARCPRCGHTLAKHMHRRFSAPFAYSVAAVMLGLVSLYFPFISFESSGISKAMSLPDALLIPYQYGYGFLSYCYLIGVLILPFAFLGIVIYLHLGAISHTPAPGGRFLTKALRYMQPWVMSDIFVVGVLVSLVKIMSLATIGFELAFIPFCLFALLLICAMQSIDYGALFERHCGPFQPLPLRAGEPGLMQGVTGCRSCGQPGKVDERGRGTCQRCGDPLRARTPYSIQITLALVITSALLYIPSMALPVMNITSVGSSEGQTIISGVLLLLSSGDFPVALVIFFASIMVPVAKVIALLWLCRKTKQPYPSRMRARMKLYHIVEFIGRWSMIDVFVVTVLTTMVQLGQIMQIVPGKGIIAFALVVLITMVAEMQFDPRLLWDALEHKADDAVPDKDEARVSQSALGQDFSQ